MNIVAQPDLNQNITQLLSKLPGIERIIFRITYLVMLTEILIMLTFDYILPKMSSLAECFIDAGLLVSITTPIIYYSIIKPYVHANKALITRMHTLAFHDDLTQLNNRRALLEYLNRLLSYNIRHSLYAAILFIDLDEFKKINDTHGHEAGDKVLTESAARLSSCVRKEDIVCRMGGDEFVILLSTLGADERLAQANALVIAERIKHIFRTPITHQSNALHLGLSIGLRLIKPEPQAIESILSDADTAMYQAKAINQSNEELNCELVVYS